MIKKCISFFLVLAFLNLTLASNLTSARSHKAGNRVKAPRASQIGFPPPQLPIIRPPISLPLVDSGGGGDNDTARNIAIGVGAAAAIVGIIYLVKKIKPSKNKNYL